MRINCRVPRQMRTGCCTSVACFDSKKVGIVLVFGGLDLILSFYLFIFFCAVVDEDRSNERTTRIQEKKKRSRKPNEIKCRPAQFPPFFPYAESRRGLYMFIKTGPGQKQHAVAKRSKPDHPSDRFSPPSPCVTWSSTHGGATYSLINPQYSKVPGRLELSTTPTRRPIPAKLRDSPLSKVFQPFD